MWQVHALCCGLFSKNSPPSFFPTSPCENPELCGALGNLFLQEALPLTQPCSNLTRLFRSSSLPSLDLEDDLLPGR